MFRYLLEFSDRKQKTNTELANRNGVFLRVPILKLQLRQKKVIRLLNSKFTSQNKFYALTLRVKGTQVLFRI